MNSFTCSHSNLVILDVILRVIIVYVMLVLQCIELAVTNLDSDKYSNC